MCRTHAELYALKAIETGACYRLKRGTTVVGRNQKKCNIILKHATVSKVHCSIYIDQDNFRFVDLGSRNGIFVNEIRTRSKELSVGDIIGVGRFRFQVVCLTEPSADKVLPAKLSNTEENGESNRDIDLLSPPSLDEKSVEYAANPTNNITQKKIFDESTEVEFFLDNDFDHEEEFHDSALSSDQYDVFPPERNKKRASYPQRIQKRARYQKNWIASLPLTVNFNNKKLRRVLFLMTVVTLCFILKLIWYPVSSESEIFNVLQAELETVKELRRNGANSSEWKELEIHLENENKPIINYLEKNANADNQVKQELLRAVRDCLPKLIQESRLDISWYEKRFEKHMETARLLLQNRGTAESNYSSQFPKTPPGS